MKVEQIVPNMRAVLDKRAITNKQAADEIGVSSMVIGKIVAQKQGWVYPDVGDKIAAWLAKWGHPISENTAIPVPDARFQTVRVFGLGQAATLNILPGDIPPEIHETDLPSIIVMADNNHRHAAFKVDGNSMAPKLTDGMYVICDCDVPVNNGDVVAIKWNSSVVIKRYRRINDVILLTSDNREDGKEYELHAKEILWMLKVVKYMGEM